MHSHHWPSLWVYKSLHSTQFPDKTIPSLYLVKFYASLHFSFQSLPERKIWCDGLHADKLCLSISSWSAVQRRLPDVLERDGLADTSHVFWLSLFQTKQCYSPKIKHFDPPQIFFSPPKFLDWLRHCLSQPSKRTRRKAIRRLCSSQRN